MMERRAARRFEMRLPVVIRAAAGGQPAEARTETIDVSSRGLYFAVDKEFAPGSPVEVVLTLPKEITMTGPVQVRCQGRVVRLEERENMQRRVGVAAVIDRYEFLRVEETPD